MAKWATLCTCLRLSRTLEPVMALESSSSHDDINIRGAVASLGSAEAPRPCSSRHEPASTWENEIEDVSPNGIFSTGVSPSASPKHASCNAQSSAASTSSCSDMEDSVSPDILARRGGRSWCISAAAAAETISSPAGLFRCDAAPVAAAAAAAAAVGAQARDATAESAAASLPLIEWASPRVDTPSRRPRPRRSIPASSHSPELFSVPSGDFGSPRRDEQRR